MADQRPRRQPARPPDGEPRSYTERPPVNSLLSSPFDDTASTGLSGMSDDLEVPQFASADSLTRAQFHENWTPHIDPPPHQNPDRSPLSQSGTPLTIQGVSNPRERCPYCRRRFSRGRDLPRHILSCHSGEFPFECAECRGIRRRWRFKRKDNYDSHRRLIHTHPHPSRQESANSSQNSPRHNIPGPRPAAAVVPSQEASSPERLPPFTEPRERLIRPSVGRRNNEANAVEYAAFSPQASHHSFPNGRNQRHSPRSIQGDLARELLEDERRSTKTAFTAPPDVVWESDAESYADAIENESQYSGAPAATMQQVTSPWSTAMSLDEHGPTLQRDVPAIPAMDYVDAEEDPFGDAISAPDLSSPLQMVCNGLSVTSDLDVGMDPLPLFQGVPLDHFSPSAVPTLPQPASGLARPTYPSTIPPDPTPQDFGNNYYSGNNTYQAPDIVQDDVNPLPLMTGDLTSTAYGGPAPASPIQRPMPPHLYGYGRQLGRAEPWSALQDFTGQWEARRHDRRR